MCPSRDGPDSLPLVPAVTRPPCARRPRTAGAQPPVVRWPRLPSQPSRAPTVDSSRAPAPTHATPPSFLCSPAPPIPQTPASRGFRSDRGRLAGRRASPFWQQKRGCGPCALSRGQSWWGGGGEAGGRRAGRPAWGAQPGRHRWLPTSFSYTSPGSLDRPHWRRTAVSVAAAGGRVALVGALIQLSHLCTRRRAIVSTVMMCLLDTSLDETHYARITEIVL